MNSHAVLPKIFIFALLVHLAPVTLAQTITLKRNVIDLYYGVNTVARSPNGKYAIRCRTPKNEALDPVLTAIAGNRRRSLGTVPRSADVFWRADSRLAVLNNYEGSNAGSLQLVMFPELKKIDLVDELVRKRAHAKSLVYEISHEYVAAQGWISSTDLLVSIYSDGLPRGRSEGPGVDFCRGYVVDTDSWKITREINRKTLHRQYGVNVCD